MQSPIHYIEQSGYHSDGNEEYAQFMEWDLDWNIVQEVWVDLDGTVFPEVPL